MMKRLIGRFSRWRRGLRRDTRALVTGVALLAVLGGGYYGMREIAQRVADHLTITVTLVSDGQGRPASGPVYKGTFGRSLAADAENLLLDDVIVNRQGGGQPNPSGAAIWHYHLAFTWLGVLVETADATTDYGPDHFTISVLGFPDQGVRSAKYDSIIVRICQDSGGVIPLAPGY